MELKVNSNYYSCLREGISNRERRRFATSNSVETVVLSCRLPDQLLVVITKVILGAVLQQAPIFVNADQRPLQ